MNSAYFFHGPLRARVLQADEKDDLAYEPEGVPQHEPFHFLVVGAAPVGSGQKGPTYFDLAFFFIVSVESRRSDDTIVLRINSDQRAAGFQRIAKEFLEDL